MEDINATSSNIKSPKNKPKLKKALTFRELLIIGLVGSFANGALFGIVVMVTDAGPEAIFAIILGAIIYASIGLSYMELVRVYPEAGGPTRYTIYTHGRWTNIINAFSDIIWYIFIPPIDVVSLLAGLNFFDSIFLKASGAPTYYGVILGIALMALFVPFNYFGVKQFGKSSVYTGFVKVFFYLSMTLGVIFFIFDYRNLYAYGVFPYGPIAIFAIMPYAMYNFGAIRVIPDLAEESNMADKIPKAIGYVILLETLVYLSVVIGVILGTDWSLLGIIPGHFNAIVPSFHGDNPYFILSKDTGVEYVFIAAVITGILAPIVTGYIYLGSGTRVLFSMGRSGYISESLKTIDKKHSIPIVSLIIFAAVGAFIVFIAAPDPSIYTFIDDATAAGYIGLITTPIAVMVTRRQGITKKNQMIRGMGIIAPVATGVNGLIVFWTGWPSEPYAVVLITAAVIIFGIISKVKIGAKNVLWYIFFIGFVTFMVGTSHDGLSSSVFPQLFTYIDGTIIVFLVSIFIVYPFGVLSGFKKQFINKRFTEELYTKRGELEWKENN